MTLLAGGWGYNNLGDEAILAGYLAHLGDRADVVVSSVDPDRTRRAQSTRRVRYVREGSRTSGTSSAILGGGGYLNGSWQPEVSLKLRRLIRQFGRQQLMVHAVELRDLDRPLTRRAATRLLDAPTLSVRDEKSARHAIELGLEQPLIVGDAISLLYGEHERYARDIPWLHGKVLLNLLDIADRSDSTQSEVDTTAWRDFCLNLLERLGDRAVCLVVGGGDYRFVRSLGQRTIVQPTTVEGLVSCLSSASGVFSVRMHPALLSTMTETPTISVPYCGKVRPTLSNLGLERFVLGSLSVDEVIDRLLTIPKASADWSRAHAAASEILSA